MKNIYTLALSLGLGLILTGCTAGPSTPAVKASDAYALDVTKVCNPKNSSAQAVLDIAKKFNPIAVKHGVEFMRFGMPATVYIDETQKAINWSAEGALTGAKARDVILVDKEGKATNNTLSINDAAERACKFAVTALITDHEASTEWKLAVPGDEYQY